MEKWHYTQNGAQFGPVTAEALRALEEQGVITSATLVWSEDLTAWTPLGFVPANILPGGANPPMSLEAAPGGPERAYPFEFHGRAGEFFRIWIVNVVLTVLTLGIYAAWAKVRTKRYFHGNTLLDGKPFDFTGNPISILKGNLIFGGLFVLNSVVGAAFPPLAILVALTIAALAPWLIAKALRFRAHNTVHRNVRFHFRGTTGESYAVFLGFPMLVGFTLGLLVPYVQFRQRKYYFGNMAWGSAAADMRGTVGFFYKTFFKVVGVVLLIAVIAVAASMVVIKSSPVAMDELRGMQEERGTPASEASTPPVEVNSTISDETEKKEEQVTVFQMLVGALGVVVVIGLYLLMFLLFTYYQVRTNNYAINSTQWGALGRLESRVRVRDLMWLYLTNGIVVLLTLGLMIPWVKVRMARYRASRTSFLCAGSLDSVASTLSAEQSAIGDAGADVFDFDIGF